MKRSVRVRQILQLVIVGIVLSVGYSNCSNPQHMDSSSEISSFSSVCENDLKKAFNDSYRVMFMRPGQCVLCHTESGVSPVKFAAADLNVAFNAFMQVTPSRVDQTALNPAHATNITGPGLQSQLTTAKAIWDPAYSAYNTCMNTGGGTLGGGEDDTSKDALTLVQKNIPTIYFGNQPPAGGYFWTLYTSDALPFTRRVPAIFSIGIRVDYNAAGEAVGYIFSNPRLQMTTGESELEVQGLIVRINGVRAPGIEQLLDARGIFRGIDPRDLRAGDVRVPLSQVSSSDKISFGFAYMELRPRTDNPPLPPTPTLALQNNRTRTNQATVNTQIGGDGTARRWCLTTSPNRPTSTAEPCPGFENQLTTGWRQTRPTDFLLTSAGLALNAAADQNIRLYLWVANSDLKINAQPAQLDIVYDATAPRLPTLFTVSPTDTQVVNLNIGDASEPVEWCVLVRDTAGAPGDGDCNNRYGPKPRFSGLRFPASGSGMNYFVLRVRDLAGNQSTFSMPPVAVNNPYGRITLSQLTNASLGSRGVFANQCLSCHGPGSTNTAALSRWNTAGGATPAPARIITVMDSGAMPPSGILPELQRELVRLWVNTGAPQ